MFSSNTEPTITVASEAANWKQFITSGRVCGFPDLVGASIDVQLESLIADARLHHRLGHDTGPGLAEEHPGWFGRR
jgi:hypothetical protein